MTSSVFPSVVSKRSGIRRWWSYFAAAALLALLCGCATEEKLPAEDLEVPQFYGALIQVLQDPKLPPNSREKYEAAKELIRHVDFEFTREVRTLNELFHYRDAIIDTPTHEDRTIVFYYPYEGHFVRLTFYTYKNAVLRVKVDEK